MVLGQITGVFPERKKKTEGEKFLFVSPCIPLKITIKQAIVQSNKHHSAIFQRKIVQRMGVEICRKRRYNKEEFEKEKHGKFITSRGRPPEKNLSDIRKTDLTKQLAKGGRKTRFL